MPLWRVFNHVCLPMFTLLAVACPFWCLFWLISSVTKVNKRNVNRFSLLTLWINIYLVCVSECENFPDELKNVKSVPSTHRTSYCPFTTSGSVLV